MTDLLCRDVQVMDQYRDTAAAAGSIDPIDPAAWAELQDLLGLQADLVLCELIDVYLEDAQRMVTSIVFANQHQDSQAMIMAAHALRSPSASLGACRLASMACQIEESLRFDPQRWPQQRLVDQMLHEVGRVCRSLKQRRPVAP